MDNKPAYVEYKAMNTAFANWVMRAMIHARDAFQSGGIENMNYKLPEKYVPVVTRLLRSGLYPGYYFGVRHYENTSTLIVSDDDGEFEEKVVAITLQEMMTQFEHHPDTPSAMAFVWVNLSDKSYGAGACAVSAEKMAFADTQVLLERLMLELRS